MSNRDLEKEPVNEHEAEAPSTVLAGRGTGLPCAYCHQPIIGEIEYEVFDACANPGGDTSTRVHVRCYEPWRARQSQAKWRS